jgi:tetratricopeptide (TPR) repeat protein
MRFFLAAWAGLALLIVAALLLLPPRPQDRSACAYPRDQDRSISGCTRIIWDIFTTEQDHAIAYINRSEAYFEKGDNDRAIADNSEAIRLIPENAPFYSYRAKPSFYTHRAIIFWRKGDYDRAIADASEAIGRDRRIIPAYIARAGAYFGKKDFDRAATDLDEAIRLDPWSALAYSQRALVDEAKGDHDHAIADSAEASRLDPSFGTPVVHGPAGPPLFRDKAN